MLETVIFENRGDKSSKMNHVLFCVKFVWFSQGKCVNVYWNRPYYTHTHKYLVYKNKILI